MSLIPDNRKIDIQIIPSILSVKYSFKFILPHPYKINFGTFRFSPELIAFLPVLTGIKSQKNNPHYRGCKLYKLLLALFLKKAYSISER